MRTLCIALLSIGISLLCGCAGDPPESSLGVTPGGDGPRVVFNVLGEPLPEIPLPNDVATQRDSSSPTGRYINVSKIAPTFLEKDMRAKANRLDGFATFATITVSFEKPLDIQAIAKAANDGDPKNDPVYLIDVDPDSPERGRMWPLDIGQGNFPVVLEKRKNYFDNDNRVTSSNLLFEVVDEDLNGNGILDPGEDSDWDGHLDKPNFLDPSATAESLLPEGYEPGEVLCETEELSTDEFPKYENLASFWEAETNTLIARTILPVRQNTTYAVVLMNSLKGQESQESIRSPFVGKSHASQEKILSGLPGLLADNGLSGDDVAFAWTYSTGSNTRELEWVRAGLYGHGKMAYLNKEFPLSSFKLDAVTDDPKQTFFASGERFAAFLSIIIADMTSDTLTQEALMSDFENTGGVVMGRFDSPNFLVDRDGIATEDYPADDDEIFEIDAVTGDSVRGHSDVTWWCLLPKRTEAHGDKPFKTIIYGHGYTSSRTETLSFAARVNRFGMALCGLDAFGHGFFLTGMVELGGLKMPLDQLIDELLTDVGLGPTAKALTTGRARDLNNDGVPDSGGDFWTADTFHTRDVVRQTVVDHMQFVRLVRSFNGKNTWEYDTNGDGFGNLAGDFDGDGIVDLGGEGDNFAMMGGSLGGIISAIMGGIEPALFGAAPVAGGAGLIDIGVRSRQGGVPEAVFLPIMGPFVVGNPGEEGGIDLTFLVNDVNKDRRHKFGNLKMATPGDRLELINLNNGEAVHAIIPSDYKFRFAVEGDALTATERRPLLGMGLPGVGETVTVTDTDALGDRIELRLYAGNTDQLKQVMSEFGQEVTFQGTVYPAGAPLVMLQKGLALRRNSPDLRRMLGIAQMILEGGDPVRYAPHYDEPLDTSYDPEARPGVNVLVVPTAGDMNVPVNTGIQIARAAGFIELTEPNPAYKGTKLEGMTENDAIIKSYTNEAVECLPRWRNSDGEPVLFDIDDLDFGMNPFGEPSLTTVYDAPPLRVTQKATFEGGGVHGMRMPLVQPGGTHGFDVPKPAATFDIDSYMNNLVGYYFYTRGQSLVDDACLEKSNCTEADNGFELPFAQADWEKKDHSK